MCMLSFWKEISFTDYPQGSIDNATQNMINVLNLFVSKCDTRSPIVAAICLLWFKQFFAFFLSLSLSLGRIFNDPKKEDHHLYRCQRQYNRRRTEKNDWRYALKWFDSFGWIVKRTVWIYLQAYWKCIRQISVCSTKIRISWTMINSCRTMVSLFQQHEHNRRQNWDSHWGK